MRSGQISSLVPDADTPASRYRSILQLPVLSNADAPPQETTWHQLYGSSLGLAIAELGATASRLIVVVTGDVQSALRLFDQVRFYSSGNQDVLMFPDWECLPYDQFSPHPDIVSQRLSVLHQMPRLNNAILVLPAASLMQRLPPRQYIDARSFHLQRGDVLDTNELSKQLQALSYHSVSQVLEPGEFCVRGGLVDVFPTGSTRPFRLDLFDDQIESIRYFEPESQRSSDVVTEIKLLPAREMPLDEPGVKQFRRAYRANFTGDPNKSDLYRDVSNGLVPAGLEFYLPLFFEQTGTFFEYLPGKAVFILQDTALDALSKTQAEIQDRYELAQLNADRPALSPQRLYLNERRITETLAMFDRITVSVFDSERRSRSGFTAKTKPPCEFQIHPRSDSPYQPFIEYLQSTKDRCLLVAESKGRREILQGLLSDHGFAVRQCDDWHSFIANDQIKLGLTVSELEQGLRIAEPAISVITESQLYGNRVLQRRRRSSAARDPEAIIRSLAELKNGDPVVHDDHGVGRYRGLKILETGGIETEFLVIEYRDSDKLYIPILSLAAVARYIGGSPDTAPLHKLGSEQWIRAKRRARDKAYDVATELLEVQALRQGHAGYAFSPPDDSYNAFTASFPFEETPDQQQGISDILDDMVSVKPMDRLVCGDVGFGKTEMALRAAFLAAQAGKQVAILVPTTLLAQQHFQTFSDRFADFPVRVELLSRFRTMQQLKNTVDAVSSGQVDVVIGTHRLLQQDIKFKNLGLVIIDEEHRFGVRQKERLKQLRSQVDVLTLTATPIPRTLNSALSGLRDISIIATPPRARLSIKTFVREWNEAAIREACLREIRRGGQVYFLHNEVRTIEKQLQILSQLVPEAQIRVAHGQMPERALESIMTDFYHQRFNILLCSTIIESGIDVPTANTIVINRADRFGLAQLHQLRGRVGRSHHQAYAYLLTPPRKQLTGDALKRLQAIAALEDLGAGFALASHDLEIRGAGELLGESQSGMIDEIGFSMYTEFLDSAIRSIKRKQGELVHTKLPSSNTEINLHVPALFPEDYLPDVHQRLVMYKRISTARTLDDLNDIRAEAVDRFGSLPQSAATLFRLAELRLKTSPLGISRVDLGAKGGRIIFSADTNIDPVRLVALIESAPYAFKMKDAQTLVIKEAMENTEQRIQILHTVTDALRLS